MKTQIIFTILAVFVYLGANSQPTISISKKNKMIQLTFVTILFITMLHQ